MSKGVSVLRSAAVLAAALLALPAASRAQENEKFLLDGTAQVAQDPNPIPKLNPSNDVIHTSLVSTGGGNFTFATVSRRLDAKAEDLTDELEAKWYFPSSGTRTCGGGSPRIQLAVDLHGTGTPDGNAFGYFGPFPTFAGCPKGKWTYEDLTDEMMRWDVTQLIAKGLTGVSGFVNTWATVVTALDAQFPNHVICTGALVDDTFTGSPSGTGDAFYDIIGIGFDTLENRTDVGGKGFATGCKPKDENEGEGEDDNGDNAKFNASASQPQTSSMMYSDPSQGMYLQSVGPARSVANNGNCVSFAGDALMNGNPGYLYNFEACSLSLLGTGVGNFAITITGPAGFTYQKGAALTSGYLSILQPLLPLL